MLLENKLSFKKEKFNLVKVTKGLFFKIAIE